MLHPYKSEFSSYDTVLKVTSRASKSDCVAFGDFWGFLGKAYEGKRLFKYSDGSMDLGEILYFVDRKDTEKRTALYAHSNVSTKKTLWAGDSVEFSTTTRVYTEKPRRISSSSSS